MTSATLPNFFIVGTAKAGTTSLSNYLGQHNDVYFCPIKEPHHFDSDTRDHIVTEAPIEISDLIDQNIHSLRISSETQYRSLFKNVSNQRAIGEATTSYLYSKTAASNLRTYNPNAKIIMVLRNPIDRAYSHYLMDIRSGWANKPFLEVATESLDRPFEDWALQYIRLGLYHDQVKRYYDAFPGSQIKFFLYEELSTDTEKVIKEACKFLTIDVSIESINYAERHNRTQLPKYSWVRPLFDHINNLEETNSINWIKDKFPRAIQQKVKSLLLTSKRIPRLTEEDRNALLPFFREDIANLSSLLDRDLSRWLN
jgi:hypothetical protein